jgi:teichuronic acid exporter
MSLKQKTISGLKWSFIDNSVNQGIQFVFGLILARLLAPKEWGLIGMLTFFIAISQVFVDSGFSSGLIRKKDCSAIDYSTVFFFNLGTGLLFYFILFFLAGPISRFYKESQLILLLRVLGLVVLINATSIIQRTILTRNINFKLQARISIIASLLSGILSIILAYKGFGVWSLVLKFIAQNVTTSSLLWFWSKWTPKFTFSKSAFREIYSFGHKLLLSSLIDTTYQNVYYLVIGKFFSATELGYYSRADQFKNPPSSDMTAIVQRVSYPVLSTLQDDPARLKSGYKKLIKSTMFISFTLMIGMAAVARPMIVVLIGGKWLPAVPYLQLLCFAAMLFPLHALNLNMINVKGRSDLFLKLEIAKKIIAVPPIVIGVFLGIQAMIIGMILASIIAYFLNSYYSAKLIDYPPNEQIMYILPSFAIAGISGAIVYAAGRTLPLKPAWLFLAQLLIGATMIPLISSMVKLDAYLEIKRIIVENIHKMRNGEIHHETN